jgi:hypothetical protein
MEPVRGRGARPQKHGWWRYVPREETAERLRTIQRLRLASYLNRRPVQIFLIIVTYTLLCLLALLKGYGALALLALLPLILAPLLGYLVYWLTWKEFNE